MAAAPIASAERIQSCSGYAAADTVGWRRVDNGGWSVLMPREYRAIKTRQIDTQVRGWSASRGRSIASDYGHADYIGDGEAPADAVVCVVGVRNQSPTIWLSTDGKRYRATHAWVRAGTVPPSNDRALMVSAAGESAADIPELLAIVRSVRWTWRPGEP